MSWAEWCGGDGVVGVGGGAVRGDRAGLVAGDAMSNDALARALRLAAEGRNYTQSQARPSPATPDQPAREGDKDGSEGPATDA